MSYLIDTNILLRIAQPTHAMHADAANATIKLKGRGEQICVIPQNLIEFWAVATRPVAANGLGMNIGEAASELERIKSFFTLLPDLPTIFAQWETIVVKHRVTGKQAHDARLVAAMKAHGLTHLLTFNNEDFKRFNDIAAVHPSSVA